MFAAEFTPDAEVSAPVTRPGPALVPFRSPSEPASAYDLSRTRATSLGHDFSHVRAHADDTSDLGAGDGERYLRGLAGGGAGHEVPHRAALEGAFGEDFSTVRSFTGRAAALDRLGAGAAAAGETVVFARAQPAARLVAHELAHVVQHRRRPVAGRAVAAHGGAAEREAESAGSTAMRGGRTSVSAAPGGAIALSPKNPFDDPTAWSSAAEAVKAMNAYRALPEADRRAAVATSYKKDLVRVLRSLPATDTVHTFVDSLREIGRWVEEDETRSSSGMTDDQIADKQAKFFTQQVADAAKAAADAAAKKKGVVAAAPTPAELDKARKDTVQATSIPKSTASWWTSLLPSEKAAWDTRGKAAIAKVVNYAKVKHPELGITAASFVLDFPANESRGLNIVAAGSPAIVGRAFVTSAELNPAYVMDVVVHEIFGHPEYGAYGSEYHLALWDKAGPKVPGYVRPAAGSDDRTTELDAYAYQETEIYAVLRSMSYRTPPTKADAAKVPNLDTQGKATWHVGLMKKQWAPALIIPILRGLRKRLVVDPRISGPALTVFDKAVEANFGAKTKIAVQA